MLKPSVGDLGAEEVKPPKIRQSLQMLKPGAGDFGVAEVKPLKTCQALQMPKASVGDLVAVSLFTWTWCATIVSPVSGWAPPGRLKPELVSPGFRSST